MLVLFLGSGGKKWPPNDLVFSLGSVKTRKKYSTSGKKEVESPFKMIRTMRFFLIYVHIILMYLLYPWYIF